MSRLASRWSLIAALAVLCGCSEPESIREYVVAKPPTPGAVWFFKLIGPAEAVGTVVGPVREFVTGVTFDERSGLPQWQLPEGWSEQDSGSSVRYKTLKTAGEPPLEIAVTQVSGKIPLSADEQSLHLNMLREQVGLSTDAEAVAATAPRQFTVGAYAGQWIDLAGETPRFGKTRLIAAMVPVPVAPRPSVQPSGAELPLAYTAPPEWKPSQGTQFSLAAFSAGEGDSAATITITPAAGRPLDNVNRWRGQAGLAVIEEDGLVDVLEPVETNGLSILATEAVGAERAILGAMIPLESGRVYFVKLDGKPERVNDERERFRTFLESFKPLE